MSNLDLKDFSVTQLCLAAGLSRNVQRSRLCLDLNINKSYITKVMKNPDFKNLLIIFQGMPFDPDLKEYTGKGTLYQTVGKLLYSEGEKLNVS